MFSRWFTMNVQQLVWCVLGSADDLAMETSKVDSPCFALALKTQQEEFALQPGANWMSTTELNSNGENDNKPAKEKDASTVPLSVLYRTLLNGKNFVSNGINLNRGYIFEATPLKRTFVQLSERREVGATTILWQKYIEYTVHQQREKWTDRRSNRPPLEKSFSRESIAESRLAFPVQARRRKTHVYVVSHTVEAVVHLRSLGVLTAAGCGIGSVHAVVRSNLLVEPFEVEEGEIVQVLGTKKTISSSCICPADGSHYKQSAVGLMFMEWAAGLAMETSKVESAVRNQAEAKLNQLEHDEPAETMTTSCKR
ncbi:hypothetical protein F511_20914 [Dorcoceras hygrometricum]|uniref:Uncharacterized protein n=1 Tax=Dorcoceras hygrometricum TaxID=472368 RepID=A0A2Z7AY21_9LAMI|nr:hypothetical protein F511_20914 [Dorcoceras hygrometricum]